MGELIAASVFHTGKGPCGKCGMKKHTEANKDCCKDVSIIVKNTDFHIVSHIYQAVPFPDFTLPPVTYWAYEDDLYSQAIVAICRAHGPPLPTSSLLSSIEICGFDSICNSNLRRQLLLVAIFCFGMVSLPSFND